MQKSAAFRANSRAWRRITLENSYRSARVENGIDLGARK
jgi:hypothetical protein